MRRCVILYNIIVITFFGGIVKIQISPLPIETHTQKIKFRRHIQGGLNILYDTKKNIGQKSQFDDNFGSVEVCYANAKKVE